MEKNYALLVGVGRREADDEGMAVTAADAETMREELVSQCRFPEAATKLLNNGNATRQSILDQLEALKKETQASRAGLVIIYFSGHGCVKNTKPYLVCWDTGAELETSALAGDVFVERLQAISAEKLLVLLDCCHAGAFAKPVDIPFDKHALLKNEPNRVILTASHAAQVSYLSKPVSLFTYAFIEGLAGKYFQGGETVVTIFDLAMYVRERVFGLSRAKQQPQFNVLQESHTGNFEVIRYPDGKPSRRYFNESFKLLDSEGKSIDSLSLPEKDLAYRNQFPWMSNTVNVVVNISGDKEIKKEKYLTTMPPSDGAIKVGRSTDIGKIIETSTTSGQVVTISGMGGLGKTTVLKMIRQELEAGERHLAWIGGRDGLRRGFNENLGLINSLELSELLIQSNKELDEVRKYEIIITALKNLGKTCLLLIDDLNLEKDASLNFIKLLRSLLPGWRVFITSRQTLPFTETYQLQFLDETSLRALFYGIYSIETNDKILSDIIQRMGFHTLAVEMLAKASQTLGLTLMELQKRLRERGLDISKITKIDVDHSETIVTNIKEYLLGIFEIAEISQMELLLLKNISVIPVDMAQLKIAGGALYGLVNRVEKVIEADENEFTMLLRGLFEKGWLLQTVEKSDDDETQDYYYQIHPLIEEFIKSKYPPTTRDCIGLVTLFTGLGMYKVDPGLRWKYTGFKISLLDGIKEESEAIFNLQISLIDDLILEGWSEDALTYLAAARELSSSIELTMENRIKLLGREVMVYAAIGNVESALQSGLELVRLKEQSGSITVDDYAELAKSYSSSGNHKQAKNALLKGYGIYKKDSKKDPVRLADLYWLEAELIQAKKKIIDTKSARLFVKSFELYENNLTKDSSTMGRVYLKFAQIAYAIDPENHFRRALGYLTISKNIFQNLVGSVHPTLLPIYTLAAKIRLAKLSNEPAEIGIALADFLESAKIIETFQRDAYSREVYEGLIQCHRLLNNGEQAILEYQEKLEKFTKPGSLKPGFNPSPGPG